MPKFKVYATVTRECERTYTAKDAASAREFFMSDLLDFNNLIWWEVEDSLEIEVRET